MFGGFFDKTYSQQELQDLEEKLKLPEVWSDPKISVPLLKLQETLIRKKNLMHRIEQEIDDLRTWVCYMHDTQDTEFLPDQYLHALSLEKEIQCLRIEQFFTDKMDERPCFLALQSGAGGTEAQDWAAMLMRMYTRWCEANGYKLEVVDETSGEEAGIKSVTLSISQGAFPYGWLKGESGVHRLVRLSPFDAAARRHTSFASVVVSPVLEESEAVPIEEKDLRIDTYRASGAGGQHVNKTDSAVRITHLPTGIVVQCQNDRSQHRNKATALKMLASKLFALEKKEKEEYAAAIQPEKKGISWGQQIRSYVLQPYQMVKDLRTGQETSNTKAVLDGQIQNFLESYLLYQATGKSQETA
ncbi:peptide chain release factor 2 [Holospora undulata]|uniref:Peptide chain release factor 2 n=1 Tax=Holospora undulata HU1 TaxID=1321371 RepID=A0A061JIR8_9PROT|nr:peptide chain release factor 2 [Holospora undulata]ETZ05039.1 peptide chain release factor 2 [Holospora undulata HU1]